ncbi:SP_1767 family glycosyltransferase [Streptococcus sp. DD12]|uniref:SP_1767 family glycosyltransferase n=1 Tax=Streptococcus sp. DD12 TaxID=1777880 RepID=UPI0007960599|nr:SP_1767 family glycosyltransferase [Streptococcus sp. DD12]KXT76197.1 Glycosyl transferase, family 8 [Streptococcus sp. DD12]
MAEKTEPLFGIHVRDIDETLDFIQAHGSSVVRLGDGEINLLSGDGIAYQDFDPNLAKELKSLAGQASTQDLVVCLPDVFEHQERYNNDVIFFWEQHLKGKGDYYASLCRAPWYGSTFISRPYMDLADKSVSAGYFKKLKQLWKGRKLLIVEGLSTRSGIGNDLFADAASVCRVICPPKNAYAVKDAIFEAIVKHGKDCLVLLMLGPTAKVLVPALVKEGIQAIDLGHIDSEYEWFKRQATSKIKLPHKHTAEHNYDVNIALAEDASYESQIVARVGVSDLWGPLVSVIVPVYNAEKFLGNCANSILAQSYKNIELILVNDGSTDGSAKICEELKATDRRVRVHHKTNGGVGSARNAGLELVRGDYILFVDNDDAISEDHISKLYRLLKKTDSDIAIGNFITLLDETANMVWHIGADKYYEEVYSPEQWFAFQYESQDYMSQVFTTPWAKLYKAELFEDVLYPTDEKVEDDYTTYRVYLAADRIAYMNEGIYVHRKRQDSVTSSVNQVHVFPLKAIEERLTLLTMMGMDTIMEQRAYRWRLELHRKALLEAGDITNYKKVVQKLRLIDKSLRQRGIID